MIRKAKRFKPDLIAFSAITNLYPSIKRITQRLKSELDVPTIVGGIHPTSLPEYVLKEKCFDMICIGEGEEAMLDLVNSMESGKENLRIKNIWFKNKNKIIKNSIRPLIQNLDKLPFPDRDLFYKYRVFSKSIRIMASRGCVFRCAYCCNNLYSKLYKNKGAYFRIRSIKNVIEEIKLNIDKYGCNFIRFEDDIFPFAFNEKLLVKFKNAYTKEVGLPFQCLIHPKIVNEKVMKLMKRSGCSHMEMGIQTANPKTRVGLNRYESNSQIIKAAKIINKNKIKLHTNLIFGLPNETFEDMWNSVKFNKKLNPYNTATFIFYPFPETELANYCISKKMMSNKHISAVKNGFGSYKTSLLIKHPFNQETMNFNALTPIFTKLPEFTFSLFKKLVKGKYTYINKFLYLMSIPFLDTKEFLQRVEDLPRTIYCTMKEYK